MKENRVLCASCKKPIKFKDFGLVEDLGNGIKWYHNNYVCLIERQLKIDKKASLTTMTCPSS